MKKLLKFYAPWCGPCKAVDIILDKLGENFFSKSNIELERINTEDNIDLAQKYNIRSIPRFVLLGQDGKIIKEMCGLVSEQELKDFID